MRRSCGPALLGVFLALCSNVSSMRAFPVAPSFTISATNVTMPLNQSSCSNGVCTEQFGYSTFTLTSVNGYTGAPQVTCAAVNPPAKPNCPRAINMG